MSSMPSISMSRFLVILLIVVLTGSTGQLVGVNNKIIDSCPMDSTWCEDPAAVSSAESATPSRLCEDINDICKEDAGAGECELNPLWMSMNCPRSCNTCHLLDPKVRCQRKTLNISDEPIYKEGDMGRMFREVVSLFGDAYNIEVLSESPWIVLFKNFLTDAEANALVETVKGKWQPSLDIGQLNENGQVTAVLTSNRSSSQSWCFYDCEERAQSVISKITAITKIPYSHFENIQVLRYRTVEYYKEHQDLRPFQLNWPSGPRILTFFMYLSDVEEGGETHFTRLGIKVKPKKGSAVLWPNALDDNLLQRDDRTHHEALPVIRGTKYAANAWLHLHDFQTSLRWDCTGAAPRNTVNQQ